MRFLDLLPGQFGSVSRSGSICNGEESQGVGNLCDNNILKALRSTIESTNTEQEIPRGLGHDFRLGGLNNPSVLASHIQLIYTSFLSVLLSCIARLTLRSAVLVAKPYLA